MIRSKKLSTVLAVILTLSMVLALGACGAKKKVVVNTKEDLKGLTVGCQVATTADESLQELAKTIEFKAKKYDQIIQTFSDLKTGRLDAVVVDGVVARDYVKKHPTDFKISPATLTNEPMGICFKKGNEQTRNLFNSIIDDFVKDGTMKKISEKWFGADITSNIENVGSAEAQGTSDATVKFPADKKKLRIGVDNTYPPMEFMDGSKTVGFDIDFASEIGKKLGVEIEIVPTAWDGIFAALNTDKYDCIISSVSISEERLQNFALTKPYIANAQVIVTRP